MLMIQRMLFVLLVLVSALDAYAAEVRPPRQKVILLTSLDLFESTRNLPFYLFWRKPYFFRYTAKLEEIFRRHFSGKGFDVEVYHYADQALLWGVLHSGEYVGIYWLSHGSPDGQGEGLASVGVFDHQMFNVAPLLQEIHPNVRVLGLIGCFSSAAFNRITDLLTWRKTNPALSVFSSGGTVDAAQELEAALRASGAALDRPGTRAGFDSECPVRRGLPVRVLRHCRAQGSRPAFFPALRFESSNGRVLGTLMSCSEGEEQQGSFFLDVQGDAPSAVDLKIIAALGNPPIEKLLESVRPSVGELQFSTPVGGLGGWELLKNGSSAKAVGVFRNIYRFKGQTPDSWGISDYRPFRCQPMPAR